MRGFLGQTLAMIAVNIRALTARGGLLAATVFCVALVVATLMGLEALRQGLQTTLEQSGRSDVAIIMRGGSQSEINSAVTREQLDALQGAPRVGKLSPEVSLVVDGYRRDDGRRANISLRGLSASGISLRRAVRLTAGRWPNPGAAELVIGGNIARTYRGMEMGAAVSIGTASWTIVGLFEAGAHVAGSEVWADLTAAQNLFNRANTVQSVRVRIDGVQSLEALTTFSKADPRLQLTVKSEAEYYAAQAARSSELTQKLAWPLALLMAVGAVVGALNIMQSALALRAGEIATFRVIGFSRGAVCAGLVLEYVLVCIIAGAIGGGAAYLLLDGLSASALAGGTTRIGYTLTFSLMAFWQGMALALAIGSLGSIIPAILAGFRPVVANVTDT
ncbi:MAG: ABC transporter permease [Pseudomonadota bacterium]